MNLSKSKYCEGITCLKKLWLSTYKPEEKEDIKESVFETGTEVGELAKKLYGNYIDIDFNTNLNQMLEDTKKALDTKGDINITEASFNYNNNFCSVDILRRIGDSYEINEVKSSTHINSIYLDDISYQYYILKNLGYKVDKCNIVILNSDYIRKGDLELDKLFSINDVTEEVIDKQKEVELNIKYINENMTKEEPKNSLDTCCKNPYDCPFFKYCTKELQHPNIFDISGMTFTKKIDYYKKGLISFKDLEKEELNPKYIEQIEYELNNKEDKLDLSSIKEFMNTLEYPLYFLDFETYQEAIPQYDGISPYMQIPFQYSLHYVNDKDGELYHKEFLAEAGIDPRRALAEAGIEGLEDKLEGPTAVIMTNEDYLEPAKAIYNFTKDHDFYKIKGGIIDGKVMTTEEIITLAKLPSKETLIGMLAGALLGNISKLAVALDQVKVQKEETANA